MRRSVPFPPEESGTGKDVVRGLLETVATIERRLLWMGSGHIVPAAPPEKTGLAALPKRTAVVWGTKCRLCAPWS